jgi:hypothetical protein
MAIKKRLMESRSLSLSPENAFIMTREETYDGMAERKALCPGQTNRISDISMIESFIEENSGGYNKKTLYEKFSGIISLKEFNEIIEKLRDSDKVLIDREGKICWVWNPELIKEIKENKKYASRWTH